MTDIKDLTPEQQEKLDKLAEIIIYLTGKEAVELAKIVERKICEKNGCKCWEKDKR